MIQISHLTKSYADQELFSDVSFTIGAQERIGLIGRNGSGKSTFLKLLLDQESHDGGTIEISPYTTIRALEQHLNFSHPTILAQVCSALPPDAQSEEWKAKSILMGLGFLESDFSRAPDQFSSGFQVRIRLAEALVSDADVLLLDEPTNYLDILSLRWLSRFLQKWKGAFVLVTHDRNFMENVVTHVVGIHRGNMRKMKGGPAKLLEQIEMEEEIYEKTRVNMEKKQEKTKEFIRAFRAGARSAGLVQSRIKSLEKQKVGKKLEKLPQIRFHFRSKEFHGNEILQAKNISFAYTEGKPIISEFSIDVFPQDRIAIIGRNGKGKSTLLKLLTEELVTQTGRVKRYGNATLGYFGAGNKENLVSTNTILEELMALPNVSEQQVRTVCGALLFSGNTVKKKISDLSGGEKSRVCLGKLILSPVNVLALDEPTNHLDMESCHALIESLKEFAGTVIFVTHDENLLSELATRLILFDKDAVSVQEQTYDEFLSSGGWSEEEEENFSVSKYKRDSENKQQYALKKQQNRELRLLKGRQERLEKSLAELELRHQENVSDYQLACQQVDHDQMRELGQIGKQLVSEMESGYEELETIISAVEELEKNLS